MKIQDSRFIIQNSEFQIQSSKINVRTHKLLFYFLIFAFSVSALFAQSTDQNFPTPITSNEISGQIKARDIGDARLTGYFYAFNGNQGDIFINVQSNNFNGDIDIFTVDNLKPVTKIVIYADASDNETGRVIYLRKPEKLLMRIEGRSPNDDAATFRIKFAGSFAAINESDKMETPAEPTVKSTNNSDVIVNSVGTIVGIKPKPTPVQQETAEKEKSAEIVKETIDKKTDDETVVAVDKKTKEKKTTAKNKTKPEVVVTENVPPENSESAETATKTKPKTKKEKTQPSETEEIDKESAEKKSPPKKAAAKKKTEKKETKEKETDNTETGKKEVEASSVNNDKKSNESAANALANINLQILFKDGTKIERPMSEVLKVGVDKGVLTVITKDGKIGRYSILDVAKFTIE